MNGIDSEPNTSCGSGLRGEMLLLQGVPHLRMGALSNSAKYVV